MTIRDDFGNLTTVSSISVSINRCRPPSKAAGRKGTRRAWKRAHPPGWFWRLFEE